eukprot:TRINITY_DN8176_c0_g1_i3.p1 TRINITY_DN8176_c0_g1~~TRINITY_DN8176_c0_g1_i3.p1  ORF type:complete len:408 (+),score=77.01 TRINITY_DN8176_c0_g1_i3:90-1313(+)
MLRRLMHDSDIREDEETLLLIDKKAGESLRTSWTVFAAAFFMTIAGVLGTGILSLPVKMTYSGFWPMFTMFTPCLLFQILVILFMVELLQRAQSLGEGTSHGPDLHTVGRLFLPRPLQIVFDFSVIIHFISILISYSLAGPQAYASFISLFVPDGRVKFFYLIAPFVVVLTLVVIFAQRFLAAVISWMTLAKGTLLIVMVVITGYLGSQQALDAVSSFAHTGEPFLIGTVALGGAVNVVPVIYAKVQPTRRDISIMRMCICAGLVICWLLNVLWCHFILEVVPQLGAPNDTATLQYALHHGQIATVPLIEIIRSLFPQLMWLAYIVTIMVMVSITVSFITISTAMKHVLDGYVHSLRDAPQYLFVQWRQLVAKCTAQNSDMVNTVILYVLHWGITLGVALGNPEVCC